jgi:hypothetical protein
MGSPHIVRGVDFQIFKFLETYMGKTEYSEGFKEMYELENTIQIPTELS